MFSSSRDSQVKTRLVLLFYYNREEQKGYYSTSIEIYSNNNNKNTISIENKIYEKQDIGYWKEFCDYINIKNTISEKDFFSLFTKCEPILFEFSKLHPLVLECIDRSKLITLDNFTNLIRLETIVCNIDKRNTIIFYYDNIPLNQ